MIFGAKNLKIIIIRKLKQVVVEIRRRARTCTSTGKGRIISENEPEIGLGLKKTSQEEPR